MPAPSPSLVDSDLVRVTLSVAGTDVSDTYQILSVQVVKAAHRISSARIVIRDGSVSGENFSASSADDLALGKKIALKVGYHEDDKTIFEGIIIRQTIRRRGDDSAQLIVECRDEAIKMTVGRKNAYYTSLSDSDIIGQIVGTYGLTAEVASTSPQLPGVTQFNCTDWDFIAIRAQINGMPILVDGGKLTIKPPDLGQTPVLSVTYGVDVLEFQMEVDARTQLSTVECAAWDAKTQAMLTSDAAAGDVNALGQDASSTLAKVIGAGTVKLTTGAAIAADSLQAWAKGAMLKAELAKISGKIKFQGSAAIAPGDLLAVGGFGSRFDGTGYVGGVTHAVEGGNWTTEVSLGLGPEWFASEAGIAADPAAGLLPPVRGLQTGVVKQIQDDPEGAFRVLVTVPVVGAEGDGIWARLATYYASNAAGNFFYPEVGDEVILGFLNEDPRFPIILGSVYSQANAAPLTPDQENSQKTILTKGQLQILFDDKKKVLTIQTPAANKMVFSDQDKSISITDQHGNSVKLSGDGIAIESVKNLTMTASQNVTVEATAGSLGAKGTKGVTVSGLNIALSADAELTAKGQASTSVTSTGPTVVKGAMVLIN